MPRKEVLYLDGEEIAFIATQIRTACLRSGVEVATDNRAVVRNAGHVMEALSRKLLEARRELHAATAAQGGG